MKQFTKSAMSALSVDPLGNSKIVDGYKWERPQLKKQNKKKNKFKMISAYYEKSLKEPESNPICRFIFLTISFYKFFITV